MRFLFANDQEAIFSPGTWSTCLLPLSLEYTYSHALKSRVLLLLRIIWHYHPVNYFIYFLRCRNHIRLVCSFNRKLSIVCAPHVSEQVFGVPCCIFCVHVAANRDSRVSLL